MRVCLNMRQLMHAVLLGRRKVPSF